MIAVACAAILVPLRVFLKPSMPQVLINLTSPIIEYKISTNVVTRHMHSKIFPISIPLIPDEI